MALTQKYQNENGILGSYVAMGIWVLLFLIGYYSNKARRDFWDIDTSLFWRYAENPELFHQTSPIIASVLEKQPGLSIDFFSWLVKFGIMQADGYVALNLLFVVFSTAFVCVGFYNVLRGLGHAPMESAVGMMVAISAPMFVGYSRMHPLATVMTQGGFSMFAMSAAVMATGLFVRGQYFASGFIASSVALFHAVTGPLVSLMVYTGAVFDRIRYVTNISIRSLMLLAILMGFIASPFLMGILESGISSASVDPSIFFSYVNSRSSNPMPLRDGIDHVYAHLAVFFSALVMLSCSSALTSVLGRMRYVGYFWLTCYALQIFLSEVIQSPELVRLVLHRISPLLFFIFASITVSHMLGLLRAKKYFILAVVLLLAFVAGEDTRLFSPWHTYHLAFCALLGSYAIYYNAAAFSQIAWLKGGYLGFVLAFCAICVSPILVGMDPKIFASWTSLLIVVGGALYQLFNNRDLANRVDRRVDVAVDIRVILIIAILFKLVSVGLAAKSVFDPAYKSVQLYSKADAVDLIKQYSDQNETIYSTVKIDLNGIRRQYLDWKHEWYALYLPNLIPDILQRAKLLGVDVQHDPKVDNYCGQYKWLYVGKCISNVLDVDSKLEKYDWRNNWEVLKNRYPSLKKVLIRVKDIRETDRVIARNDRFALVAPY